MLSPKLGQNLKSSCSTRQERSRRKGATDPATSTYALTSQLLPQHTQIPFLAATRSPVWPPRALESGSSPPTAHPQGLLEMLALPAGYSQSQFTSFATEAQRKQRGHRFQSKQESVLPSCRLVTSYFLLQTLGGMVEEPLTSLRPGHMATVSAEPGRDTITAQLQRQAPENP